MKFLLAAVLFATALSATKPNPVRGARSTFKARSSCATVCQRQAASMPQWHARTELTGRAFFQR
jgi:hypothetical protein